uniref:Lysophosphatidic acid receptor 3 n=1 Tax=Sparus aurata TaxID=8175 RepID=A0A671UY38_SPAAU
MDQQNRSCHYNESMGFFYHNIKAEDKWDKTQLILVQVVGSLFCCFILVSNAMVIAAVITNKRFHYPFYYLLSNLAASDFLAGIAYVYLMFNTGEVSRKLTVKGYFLRQGLLDISLSASLANLLVIALERYISVMNWKVHSNLTKRRVTLLIVLVWAISIFMGAVPSLGWNCICNLSDCSQLAPIFSRSYLIFWSVSNLVVFLVMVVIYMRIYTYVKKKTSVLTPHTSGSINRKRTPIKLIKTVMVVLGHCCSACVANRPHHTTLASNERPLLPTHQKRNKKAERKWKKKLYLRSIAFTSFAQFPSGLWKFKQVSFLKFPVKIVEKCLMHFYNRTSERNRNFIFKGYQKFIFSSFLF